MSLCDDCQRECDGFVTDGERVLCRECARNRADVIYKKLYEVFNTFSKLDRVSFAFYGNDDFWNLINEEIEE